MNYHNRNDDNHRSVLLLDRRVDWLAEGARRALIRVLWLLDFYYPNAPIVYLESNDEA